MPCSSASVRCICRSQSGHYNMLPQKHPNRMTTHFQSLSTPAPAIAHVNFVQTAAGIEPELPGKETDQALGGINALMVYKARVEDYEAEALEKVKANSR